MAVCCWGREGLGLRNMTTPDQNARAIDAWQRSKRLPLPRKSEQRDHISSSSQDQPARGKLLECLLKAQREHIESQCRTEKSQNASTGTSYSSCFHDVIQAWHLLSMTRTVLEMLGQFMSSTGHTGSQGSAGNTTVIEEVHCRCGDEEPSRNQCTLRE